MEKKRENILVSACLLGLGCRYDGSSKADERVAKLLEREDITLIPVCPEQLGGMETPREPSERIGEEVRNRLGEDVTSCYRKGAEETVKMARLYRCRRAVLKERSPSCGCGQIYDGSFSKTLIRGDGVTAELLKSCGIQVLGESGAGEI